MATITIANSVTYARADGRSIKSSTSTSYTITDDVVSQQFSVPDLTTDDSVSFGELAAARVLYVSTDQDISIKINSNTADPITILADNSIAVDWGADITALYITNASGEDANIDLLLAK